MRLSPPESLNPYLRSMVLARTWIGSRAPGLMAVLVIAAAAKFLEEHHGGPVMLYALLLGMAMNFISDSSRTAIGIQCATSVILRLGVALIGIQITIFDILSLGLPALSFVAAIVATTVSIGFLIGRLGRLDSARAALSAGAVAICGASAALALAAVLPRSSEVQRDVAVTVVAVTALSTLAMISHPLIAAGFGLTDVQAGLFIGASIHDVAQVVGAGYTVSQVAGDTATIVKLERVMFLAPVAVIYATIFSMGARSRQAPSLPSVPLFLIAFFALAGARSFDLIHPAVVDFTAEISRWCLVAAIAAVGVSTRLGEAFRSSWRLLIVLALQTVVIGSLAIAGAKFLPIAGP